MASNDQRSERSGEKNHSLDKNSKPSKNPKRDGRASAKSGDKAALTARASDYASAGSGLQHGKHHARNEDWDDLPSNTGR